MAITSLLKANQLLFSSWRQNFHENPCYIRSTKLVISRRFNGFKAKSFLDSTPSASNTGKTKTAVFPFKFEAKTTSTGSISKGNNFYDEVVFSTILKTLKWLKVPVVVILLLFVSMYDRDPALAARSGGAMGGSSFSSSSSSSSSKPSSSSSSSSRSSSSGSRSRSGSGSGSSSSSHRSSSGSSSRSGSRSSSSSYRSSSGSSSGSSRSGGIMGGHSFSSSSSSKPSSSSSSSRPSSSSSSSSRPSSSSSNDYHSYISSSTETRSSSPDWYSSSSYHTSSSPSPSATATDKMMTKPKVQERVQVQRELSKKEIQEIINAIIILLVLIVLDGTENMFNNWREARENRTRVIKLQVGMHICGLSFEKSINRIAETADTSTSSGLIYILQETAKALSNHSASWLAVNSSVKVNESMEEAEEYFKKLSIDEREKYDKETLINLDNVKSDSISDQNDNNMSRDRDTYMVVTILVAAKGKAALNFPNKIASKEDLKEAFKELQIISKSAEVQAVNVVWTPQDENEVMSREELYQVYPTLLEIGGDS